MNAYLNYMVESNICLMVFMLFYSILLTRETEFNIKRIILLGAIIISVLFPLIHIESTAIGASVSEVIPTIWLPEITIGANVSEKEMFSSGISWIQAVTYVYVSGMIFFLTTFTFQLTKIALLIKRSVFISCGKLKISESVLNFPSFSFFHYISIGNAPLLSAEEKTKIIKHESVHATRFHSFDILLLNILKIFFWFNPIIGTYKKILIELHEFEADARSVEKDAIHDYCNLLAKVALMSADLRLANYFTNSLTLKRIEMIRKIKLTISRWKLLAIGAVVPLLFYVIACEDQVTQEVKDLAQNSSVSLEAPLHVTERLELLIKGKPEAKFILLELNEDGSETLKRIEKSYGLPKSVEVFKENSEEPAAKVSAEEIHITSSSKKQNERSFVILEYANNNLAELSQEDGVFTIVDETARPQGGMEELHNFIGSKLLYPPDARANRIEGRVFVEFIVEKDGSVTNPTVVKGVDPLLDKAALDMVSLFPKWIPGKNKGQAVRQKMVLPLSFKLG